MRVLGRTSTCLPPRRSAQNGNGGLSNSIRPNKHAREAALDIHELLDKHEAALPFGSVGDGDGVFVVIMVGRYVASVLVVLQESPHISQFYPDDDHRLWIVLYPIRLS